MNPTAVQGPRVVHSSRGRLRVHLPDPDARIVAHLRGLPGVTSAEARELTGNILILFDPAQTTETTLLAELEPYCLPAPTAPAPAPRAVRVVVEQDDRVVSDPQPAGYVTGVRRRVYKALGWGCVGLGVVGAALPGLPTVPFLLLASYFFLRSSPWAHDWLWRSRWFGPMLRDWQEHHGVSRSVKVTAGGLIGTGLVFTWLAGLPAAVTGTILALEAIGLVVVLRLPVVEKETPAPVLATV